MMVLLLSATCDVQAFRPSFRVQRCLTAAAATHSVDGNTIEGDLVPVSNNLLIKVREAADQTQGGLFIPDEAKEKLNEGLVVAAGPGKIHPETGVKLTMAAAVGDKVLYGKYDGVEMQYDSVTHQLIKDDDILLAYDGADATLDNVRCLKDNILIEPPPKSDKSKAGVILKIESDEDPSAADKPVYGKVLKVGPGRQASNGQLMAMPVSEGENCRFRNFAGSEVTVAGKDYLVIKGYDVQAKW